MAYKFSKGDRGLGDIKFEDDSDTGIDFDQDQIDFQTSGSTRMQIHNAGVDVQGDLSVADVFLIGQDGKVNQGSSDAPVNSYVLRHNATDGNNGMMIMNNSTSISTDNLLGGIGFDSNDGNEPSSILEASVYIAGYAAEAHGAFDKGGYLVLGVSQINDNDDTISTEILRMEQGSITTTVPIHISGSQTEGLRIGKTASGFSEIQFETEGVDTAFIQVDSSEGMIIGCQSLNDEISFQTTGTDGTLERMRIESSGDIGIGVTNAL